MALSEDVITKVPQGFVVTFWNISLIVVVAAGKALVLHPDTTVAPLILSLVAVLQVAENEQQVVTVELDILVVCV